MSDRLLCSTAALGRSESLTATASRIDRWLLVEASGPWGARALPQVRDVQEAALLAIQQRAKVRHARTVLIRRPGRAHPSDGSRTVFIADSRPGQERLLTRNVTDEELAALPLPFDDDPIGWANVPALVGVCTHGSHDPCCAVRGRPVAAALARSHPALTWEISHIGGDRFAANALVLPGGHYLGQLVPGSAPAVVDRLLAGERPDPHYRGRSCWAMPVQAAVSAAAEQLGISALDALAPRTVSRIAAQRWQVELDVVGAKPVSVVIDQRFAPAARLTCRAADEQPVPAWDVISVG